MCAFEASKLTPTINHREIKALTNFFFEKSYTILFLSYSHEISRPSQKFFYKYMNNVYMAFKINNKLKFNNDYLKFNSNFKRHITFKITQ